MIALFDFIPNHCPFCGAKILHEWSGDQVETFYAHITHMCPCGVHLQYVKTRHLVAAGGQEGNLPWFHSEVKTKFNPMGYKHLCVVCLKHPVEIEHVICRDCNERLHGKGLSGAEVSRLYAELDYRQQDRKETQ